VVGVTRLCGESSNSRVSDSQPPFHGGSDLRLCQAPRTTARTRSLVFSLTLYRYVLLMKCLSPVVLFLDNLPIGQSVCLDSLFRRNSCVFGDKKTHDRLPVPLLPLCVRLPAAMAALCRSGVARERMARFLASSLRRTAVSPRWYYTRYSYSLYLVPFTFHQFVRSSLAVTNQAVGLTAWWRILEVVWKIQDFELGEHSLRGNPAGKQDRKN